MIHESDRATSLKAPLICIESAQLDDAGEKTRQRKENRSEMRELADADGKEIEISFALDQSNQDTQKLMEALGQDWPLRQTLHVRRRWHRHDGASP